MSDERKVALRVGTFLILALVIAAFAVFMLGEKSGLFASKDTLYAHFRDINGLVPGAPVRLAGLDVGRVNSITFSDNLENREARVELSIESRFMDRIRTDSRAFIDSKGLLGDKLVNISIGDVANPRLHDGDTIKTRSSISIEEMANKFDSAVASITHVTDQAGTFLEGLADPQMRADLKRIAHSTADLLEGVAQRDGFAHRLIYDKVYADEFAGILRETHGTMANLRRAVDHLQSVAGAVRTGKGTLHELIYDPNGAQAITELKRAASELATLMHAVRSEPGALHSLIYDEHSGAILQQWSEISARINRMTQQVEKGRGTLGGLLVDPSVYEDLKTVLGNVERNVLLKALIRYTIKEDGLQRPSVVPVQPESDSAQ